MGKHDTRQAKYSEIMVYFNGWTPLNIMFCIYTVNIEILPKLFCQLFSFWKKNICFGFVCTLLSPVCTSLTKLTGWGHGKWIKVHPPFQAPSVRSPNEYTDWSNRLINMLWNKILKWRQWSYLCKQPDSYLRCCIRQETLLFLYHCGSFMIKQFANDYRTPAKKDTAHGVNFLIKTINTISQQKE
jgi:hypothetical protein